MNVIAAFREITTNAFFVLKLTVLFSPFIRKGPNVMFLYLSSTHFHASSYWALVELVHFSLWESSVFPNMMQEIWTKWCYDLIRNILQDIKVTKKCTIPHSPHLVGHLCWYHNQKVANIVVANSTVTSSPVTKILMTNAILTNNSVINSVINNTINWIHGNQQYRNTHHSVQQLSDQ